MKFFISLTIFIFLGLQAMSSNLPTQYTTLFYCQYPAETKPYGMAVIYDPHSKPKIYGRLFGYDKMPQKLKVKTLPVLAAYKDFFALNIATKLRVSWPQVFYVTIYSVGSVDDDMSGAVGGPDSL